MGKVKFHRNGKATITELSKEEQVLLCYLTGEFVHGGNPLHDVFEGLYKKVNADGSFDYMEVIDHYGAFPINQETLQKVVENMK